MQTVAIARRWHCKTNLFWEKILVHCYKTLTGIWKYKCKNVSDFFFKILSNCKRGECEWYQTKILIFNVETLSQKNTLFIYLFFSSSIIQLPFACFNLIDLNLKPEASLNTLSSPNKASKCVATNAHFIF
jgi:hypothetical protein